jgi:hypothetical protein
VEPLKPGNQQRSLKSLPHPGVLLHSTGMIRLDFASGYKIPQLFMKENMGAPFSGQIAPKKNGGTPFLGQIASKTAVCELSVYVFSVNGSSAKS